MVEVPLDDDSGRDPGADQTGRPLAELTDLDLDCVHEVPGSGAWLKIPLGRLLTERMVPIDEETVEFVDRILRHRSAGRPLRHPRTGKLADFLLTHQGRRVSADTLRHSLEAVAGKVRRHEETICRLRRAWREPRQ